MYKNILRLFILITVFCFGTNAAVLANDNGFFANDTIIPNDTIMSPPAVPENLQDTLPANGLRREIGTQGEDEEPQRRPRQTIIVPGAAPMPDDLPMSAVPWYHEDQLQNPFTLKPNYLDTTLRGLQMYDYAAAEGNFYAQKGNPGHAHRQLRFSPSLQPGLRLHEYDTWGAYLLNHDDIKFYRPAHVFTELFYLTGTAREQLFYGKHNQKFHETFHAGMNYRVINSPGPISRMGARNTNLYVYADYLSPDNRYQALSSFTYNRLRNMESGGLTNHLGFEENRDRDSVFLYRAESWIYDMSFNLHHFYQTGFYAAADEGEEDRFVNLGRINHNFSYSRTSFVFNDQAPPLRIYPFPLMESNFTFDSTVVHRIENSVSWSNFPLTSGKGNFPLNFKLFASHSINTIKQPDFRPQEAPLRDEENKRIYYHSQNTFNSVVQGVEVQTDQRKLLSLGGYANATIGGYHNEDVHTGAWLNLGRPQRNYNLEVMLRYSRTEAPYFYSNMSVNNVRWEYDFDKMQVVNLRGQLRFPFITLEGNYFLLDNFVYLGPDALPVQNNNVAGLISLGLYSEIKAAFLGLRNHVLVQKASTNNLERFPELISYHSVYAEFQLFSNSLMNQIGFDFHFNTGYRAMAYMPMIRGFYIQDEHRLNNRYLLDVFWNGKVSNARLFVKYQNILGLLLDNNVHYDIPFYPLPETMFKFGVSWMFFN
jgi:hypothetical protein